MKITLAPRLPISIKTRAQDRVQMEERDIPYDDDALRRVHEVIQVIHYEHGERPQMLAVGVRVYFSVRSWCETVFRRQRGETYAPSPHNMHFVAGASQHTLEVEGVKLMLCPFVHEDTILPLFGDEGAHLALPMEGSEKVTLKKKKPARVAIIIRDDSGHARVKRAMPALSGMRYRIMGDELPLIQGMGISCIELAYEEDEP